MLDAEEFRRFLDFTREPLFIVRRSGKIEMANASARAVLGTSLVGRHLGEFTTTAHDVLHTYLRRCSASGSPVIASIMLHNGNGQEDRFQIKGALLSKQPGQEADRIVLRCSATAFGDFTRFSRRVEELNEENRRQRHARAVLEEALSQRDLLLREVQHRVRNHTQMMLGMVAAARRKAEGEELSGFLEELTRRLTAMGTVQQLMYTSAQLEALSAQRLLHDICGAIAKTWPPGAELVIDCIDTELDNEVAIPVALILSELLSNALKHGLKYGSGTIKVKLEAAHDEMVLSVWDSGPGFAADNSGGGASSSGLSLVRGMCRQIGASFDITGEGGTCCIVRFPREVR